MTDCARCDKRTQLGYVVCVRCAEQLRRKLRDIETYMSMLPALTQPVRRELGRHAPGFGSCSPANDDVIVALDVRSTVGVHGPDDIEIPIRSIVVSLAELADWVRDSQGVRGLSADLPYLLAAVDWCVRQQEVAVAFAQRVSVLHAQCRRLAQDEPPGSMGTCIKVGCKGDVYPQREEGAVCQRCEYFYDGLDLVRFKVAQ